MKHNIVIAAGGQVFEFEGEVVELETDHLILRAKRGDIYIERKYLVFIQTLNEQEEATVPETTSAPLPVIVRPQKIDQAARFLNKQLKHDPVAQKLEEKVVPPSQFPDDDIDYTYEVDEDEEAVSNVMAAYHGVNNPITKATNLRQAAQIAMKNEDKDFSMNMGSVEYKNPLQTVLGIANAGNKKTRVS